MKIDNLVPHIATSEDDNSFVGMKIIGNHIHFYYPESYHFDLDNFDKDDFLDLLKTISIAKTHSKDTVGTYDSRDDESQWAFFSYIWIIEDYIKNGIYTNSEKILKVNQRGKINWKKTFQKQPIVSNGNVIYQDLYTELKSPMDSIIVDAHKFCVKKSIKLIGWLYELVPEVIEVNANASQLIPYYLNEIKLALDRTFDDEKRMRLIHMENVLIGLDEDVNEKDIVYGVDSYHYVYEQMIDRVFGTENAKEYYPSFTWHLKYTTNDKGLSGPTIRPDTIMKNGKDIYIIDAKFYRYGSLNLAKTNGLPEASSIVKQITYGAYVKSVHPDANVYNVFILPYDANGNNSQIIREEDKKLVYIGEVDSSWEKDKTYGVIYTFLIDLKHVVKTWNKINHDDERNDLANKIGQILC